MNGGPGKSNLTTETRRRGEEPLPADSADGRRLGKWRAMTFVGKQVTGTPCKKPADFPLYSCHWKSWGHYPARIIGQFGDRTSTEDRFASPIPAFFSPSRTVGRNPLRRTRPRFHRIYPCVVRYLVAATVTGCASALFGSCAGRSNSRNASRCVMNSAGT
jgi:hypothetical protein